MAMFVDGEQIMDRTELWSVKQASTDGEDREIAFPEGEAEARKFQIAFGGRLWKRAMFVTEGEEVAAVSLEETQDMMG